MSEIFGDSELGELPSGSSESNYVAQLGRISGKLLKENLVRNGVDLAFENNLLYLKVSPIIAGSSIDDDADPNYDSTLPAALSGTGIGIKTDVPVYDLDVSTNIRTTNGSVTGQANLDNVIINAAGYFSTSVGSLHIQPAGTQTFLTHERMTTANLEFNDNFIGSFANANITLDPNGSGTIEWQATTEISQNLSVTGNIQTAGDLSTASQLIIGDSPLDVVVIAPDFKQSIIPGANLTYNLGASDKRWRSVYSPDLTNVNTIIPDSADVSDQLRIDGLNRTIFAMQSNDDTFLSPSTGITYIEQLKFQGNFITNPVNVRALNGTAVADGMTRAAAGDPSAAFWNNSATGTEIFTGGGTTLITSRTSKLGDIRNDIDNFEVINTDDSNLAISVANRTGGTLNEQLWFHNTIKPAIYASPSLTLEYSNGIPTTNVPVTLKSTGIGYVTFNNTNAMVIPSGTSAERQYSEIGETRWNTELNYLECFDGNQYLISTGAGEVVSTDLMTELAITRALILT
jgi:hypothetical protein